MRIANATITTTKASQYLIAVCRHGNRIDHRILARHGGGRANRPQVRHIEWTDTHGTLDLNWGRCVFHARPDELTVRIEADDDEHLAQVQQTIARDLERYGLRENLTIDCGDNPTPHRPIGHQSPRQLVIVGFPWRPTRQSPAGRRDPFGSC